MKGKRTETKGTKKWLIVTDYLVNNGQTLIFVIYEGLKILPVWVRPPLGAPVRA